VLVGSSLFVKTVDLESSCSDKRISRRKACGEGAGIELQLGIHGLHKNQVRGKPRNNIMVFVYTILAEKKPLLQSQPLTHRHRKFSHPTTFPVLWCAIIQSPSSR